MIRVSSNEPLKVLAAIQNQNQSQRLRYGGFNATFLSGEQNY